MRGLMPRWTPPHQTLWESWADLRDSGCCGSRTRGGCYTACEIMRVTQDQTDDSGHSELAVVMDKTTSDC